MNLNALSALAVFALFLGFAAGFFLTAPADAQARVIVGLPFSFVSGGLLSEFNAFFFSLIFSLLLFGLGAPIALGWLGLHYGGLVAQGSVKLFDLSFVLPQVFAAIAATAIGAGVLRDYRGLQGIFDAWDEAVKFFVLGLVLLVLLLLVRPLVIGVSP